MVADYVYPSLSLEFQIGPAIASEDTNDCITALRRESVVLATSIALALKLFFGGF